MSEKCDDFAVCNTECPFYQRETDENDGLYHEWCYARPYCMKYEMRIEALEDRKIC